MNSKIKLKEVYEVEKQFGAFYTGGPVFWTSDGAQLFCLKMGRINVVSVDTVAVERTIGDDLDDELEDTIYTFALSPQDDSLITAHKSSLLKLWEAGTGTLKKSWRSQHQGPIPQLAFNPDQTLIASGGSDSVVRIWDHAKLICVGALRGCQGVISVLAFHPTENVVLAAGNNHTIIAWSLESRQMVKQFASHFSTVTSLAFKDNFMVSCGRDKVVILWDFVEHKHVRTIPVYEALEAVVVLEGGSKLPGKVKLDPERVYVATAGEEGIVKVWEMSESRIVFKQENSLVSKAAEEGGLALTHMLWNRALRQLALVSVDHNIIIHRLKTFECVKQLVGFSDEILDLVTLGSKGRFIAMATNSADIKLYDTETMNCQLLKGHGDIVIALAAKGKVLVSSGKDNAIKVWSLDPESGKATLHGSGQRHTAAVGAVALTEELLVSGSQDKCIKLWRLPDFGAAETPTTLTCLATQLAHDKDINSVCVAPNNKLIASGSQDKTAKLWSATDLSLIGVLRGHRRGIWSVRFSPVDQVLLTTAADCAIRFWSLVDLSCLKSLEGHESSVLRAEFLSSGAQIISAGADGLLKLWNYKTSECMQTLDRHEARIWALTVAPDEAIFYSGGADSLLVRWRDVTEKRREEAVRQRQEVALQEQQLNNLLAQRKLLKALKLALKLDRPLMTLRIINNVIRTREAGIEETLAGLSDALKESLLRHAVTWNTNSRNSRPAQLVLNVLLMDVLAGRLRVTGLGKTVEELLPYTERHFKRTTEYLKDLKFIEYTLRAMQPLGFDATSGVGGTEVAIKEEQEDYSSGDE